MTGEEKKRRDENGLLHQPPNASDLRRHPPAGPECARMRGLMRDFVDGELGPVTAAHLEQHVSECRDCALALARAEHELLRIRQVFEAEREARPAVLRPGFGDEIVARLTRETEEEAQGADPVRSRLSDASSFSLLGSLVLGAAVLTLLVLAQGWFVTPALDGPESRARLTITSAVDARALFGDRQLMLRPGSGLGDDQLVYVGAEGAAQAEWHDASSKPQPAATLRMSGNAAVRLKEGRPVLVNGELRVETRRPVSIAVRDGSRLELGVGSYLLTADDLGRSGDWEAMDRAPDALRVAVEVLSGDEARVVRVGHPTVVVGPGSTGLYGIGDGVQVTSGGTPGLARGAGSPPPEEIGLGSFRGVVWERSGVPAVGAGVVVTYVSHGRAQTGAAVVQSEGGFRLETGGPGQPMPCESPFAVVQVLPEAHRRDLGILVPDAYRVDLEETEASLREALVCDPTTDFEGRVYDDAGVPLFGVRVVPCVVDEILGVLLPWIEGQEVSDASGLYHLHRLPGRLPPHQRLVAVLIHPEFETAVLDIPVRGSAAALQVVGEYTLKRQRVVKVLGLMPNATVQIYEEVLGLPGGTGARVYSVHSDAGGVVSGFGAGRGRLWVNSGSAVQPMLRELVLDSHFLEPTYRLGGSAAMPVGSLFDTKQVVPGTNLALSVGYRHEHLVSTGSAGENVDCLVIDSLSGFGVSGAQMFVLEPDGVRGRAVARFAGFTSAAGTARIQLGPRALGVLVIGELGAVAWRAASLVRDQFGVVPISPFGRIRLSNALVGSLMSGAQVVDVHLERLGPKLGTLSSFHRYALAAEGWLVDRVPAGEYRVLLGTREFTATVSPGGTMLLR